MYLRHLFLSPEPGPTGGSAGGAGPTPPAGGAPAGGANPPAAGAGVPPSGGERPEGGKGDDLASLKSKVEALEAEKAARDKSAADSAAAAEAERQAKLTETQKLQEKLAALESEQAASKAELRKAKLDSAAERLGVLPNYRKFLPDVDPSDVAGAAELEKWSKEHPEAIRARGTDAPRPPLSNQLVDIVTGKTKSALVTSGLLKKFGVG